VTHAAPTAFPNAGRHAPLNAAQCGIRTHREM